MYLYINIRTNPIRRNITPLLIIGAAIGNSSLTAIMNNNISDLACNPTGTSRSTYRIDF